MIVVGLVLAGVVGGVMLGYLVARLRPTRPSCGHWSCSSRADQRCVAGNCTYHCQSLMGCNGVCIHLWEDAVKRGEIPLPGGDGRAQVDLAFLEKPPK